MSAAQLHGGKNPFSGKLFAETAVKKEAGLAGRSRTAFQTADLRHMLQVPLFLEPASMSPVSDPAVQLEQATFWCVLIAVDTVMCLGEIAMPLPTDSRAEHGVEIISLVCDATRSFKTEAGDRKIPLHPELIRLGLPGFARAAQRSRASCLFPGAKDSAYAEQRGANVSKWFTRWRRGIGLDSPRMPVHAFRHTFKTVLKAKVPGANTLIDQLVEHKPGSAGAENDTDPLPIRTKADRSPGSVTRSISRSCS